MAYDHGGIKARRLCVSRPCVRPAEMPATHHGAPEAITAGSKNNCIRMCANHDEHRLEHTRGDGQRDDRGVRSERSSGDGTNDVGDRAGTDGGDADRIGVAKGHGDGGPDYSAASGVMKIFPLRAAHTQPRRDYRPPPRRKS
jgi:hypothetical protein